MLDKNFKRLRRLSNIHIQHFFSLSSVHSLIFKIATYKGAVATVLTELSIQMIKNLVEGKQENGSKGEEKVATSKTYFRSYGLKTEWASKICSAGVSLTRTSY